MKNMRFLLAALIVFSLPSLQSGKELRPNQRVASGPGVRANPSSSGQWAFLGAPTVNGTSYPGVEQIVVDAEDQRILYA